MAGKEKKTRFEGYDLNYIESLLNVVKNDVQDNTVIGEDDYLKVAHDACEKFNEEFEGEFFDRIDGGSKL